MIESSKLVLILMTLIHMSAFDEEKSGKYGRHAVEMLTVLRSSKNYGKSLKRLASSLL